MTDSAKYPPLRSPKVGAVQSFIIGCARRVLRFGLSIPYLSAVCWRAAPILRRLFARDLEILTYYDGDIAIQANLADHIEGQIFWQGAQAGDRGELKLLDRILEPDHVFLDIGANVGVFTLFAAKRVPNGQVHAFEPFRHHLERLDQNLLLNGYGNIQVHNIALSDRGGTAILHVPKSRNTGMASLFGHQGHGCESTVHHVQLEQLDDFVETAGLKRIDVIKLDVEGAELDVLRGGARAIREFRPMVAMEVSKDHIGRAGHTLDDVIEFWRSFDYAIRRIEHGGDLTSIAVADDFIAHQNIFCVPR